MSAANAPGLNDSVSDIAARFVDARLSHTALSDYPGRRPLDMATAYATQDAAIDLFPDEIIGWKVGGVPPSQQAILGVHRVSGPIFARNLWTDTGANNVLPAIEGGFAAVEAEFIIRIGAGVDPDRKSVV